MLTLKYFSGCCNILLRNKYIQQNYKFSALYRQHKALALFSVTSHFVNYCTFVAIYVGIHAFQVCFAFSLFYGSKYYLLISSKFKCIELVVRYNIFNQV